MSSFYRDTILGEPEVSFNFDTSSITRDNLDECIQKVSRELFSQRPATEPYVRAFMVFGSYLHWKLREESWYHVELLLESMATVLENESFEPPTSIFDWIEILLIAYMGIFC